MGKFPALPQTEAERESTQGLVFQMDPSPCADGKWPRLMCRVEGSQGGQDGLSVVYSRYRNWTRHKAAPSFNLHTFRERNFRAFLEKTKMEWKTEPAFLQWLKEESALTMPEDRLKVEDKRRCMCPAISPKRCCPLNQPREAALQSSTLRGLCSGPSLASHLPVGSLETPNITDTQGNEC